MGQIGQVRRGRPDPGRPAAGRARRAADGFTLVELLLAVVIMGAAIIVLAASLGTTARLSDAAHRGGRVEAEARRAAERLRSNSGVAYRRCDQENARDDGSGTIAPRRLAADYLADLYPDGDDAGSAPDLPANMDVAVTRIQIWDNDTSAPEFVDLPCGPVGEGQVSGHDTGLQQLTLRVRSTVEPEVSREVVVVKRSDRRFG